VQGSDELVGGARLPLQAAELPILAKNARMEAALAKGWGNLNCGGFHGQPARLRRSSLLSVHFSRHPSWISEKSFTIDFPDLFGIELSFVR
jgi:hypothetical protein